MIGDLRNPQDCVHSRETEPRIYRCWYPFCDGTLLEKIRTQCTVRPTVCDKCRYFTPKY